MVKKRVNRAVAASFAVLIFGAGVLVMRSWRQFLVMSVVAGVVCAKAPAVKRVASIITVTFFMILMVFVFC